MNIQPINIVNTRSNCENNRQKAAFGNWISTIDDEKKIIIAIGESNKSAAKPWPQEQLKLICHKFIDDLSLLKDKYYGSEVVDIRLFRGAKGPSDIYCLVNPNDIYLSKVKLSNPDGKDYRVFKGNIIDEEIGNVIYSDEIDFWKRIDAFATDIIEKYRKKK